MLQPELNPLGVGQLETDVGGHLRRLGRVFAEIDHRRENFSGNLAWGVEIDGHRWFVKCATSPAGVAWRESAERFHHAVRHPVLVPVLGSLPIEGGGRALVMPWFEGSVLSDATQPGGNRKDPGSNYQLFRALPVDRILDALDSIYDAHLAVAAAGYVAVDFYDGAVMYDFASHEVRLIDLDVYQLGPYVLQRDRQFGSTRFMAPEEFQRGATIDERTTVFTLARTAFVFLSDDPEGDQHLARWRAGPGLHAVAARATAPVPADRYPTVSEFVTAWRAAR